MYYYIRSEDQLWTVGTGIRGKGGNWEPESDHNSESKAAARVHFLNGGSDSTELQTQINELKAKVAELEELLNSDEAPAETIRKNADAARWTK